jgi:hypothetical protein
MKSCSEGKSSTQTTSFSVTELIRLLLNENRTPFAALAAVDPAMIPEGDTMDDFVRKRMYERILSYKDDLQFISGDANWSVVVSDKAKQIMHSLIRASKAQRLTMKDLLQDNSWWKLHIPYAGSC